MRELSYSAPQTRVVSTQLTIDFKGQEYDVKSVPSVEVKETVLVTMNPWRNDGSVQIITADDEGKKVIHVIEPIKKDEFGFPINAPIFGEEYKRHADSAVDKNRKAVERLVMDASTDEEAKQNRKGKKVPFGGRIDPMKNVTDTQLVDYLPKRGTASDVVAPTVEYKPLTIAAAARRLAAHPDGFWNGSEHFAWLSQRYPNGVPEEELSAIAQQLQQVNVTPLRLIK